MKREIRGVVPPIVTLLTESRDFDKKSYAKLIEHLMSGGVGGLFVLGSSSEIVFSMNWRRDEIFKAAAEFVKGRVPVLAGVVDMEANRVKGRTKHAVDLDADVAVATAPLYVPQTMTEVERYFHLLAEALPTPVWAYDALVCVHTELPGDLLLRLGEGEVFVGVKDSSGNDAVFRQLCLDNKDAGRLLSLLTGHEAVVDGAYLSGADGSVSGLGNVDPVGYARQRQASQAGDWAKVREKQNGLVRLVHITDVKGVGGSDADIEPPRIALWLLDIFASNTIPEPVTALGGENAEHVRGVLHEVGSLP